MLAAAMRPRTWVQVIDANNERVVGSYVIDAVLTEDEVTRLLIGLDKKKIIKLPKLFVLEVDIGDAPPPTADDWLGLPSGIPLDP